jgi:transcriptional regulator with XRE-family HTH domain
VSHHLSSKDSPWNQTRGKDKMAHLQPERLRECMTAARLDLNSVADRSGIRHNFLQQALNGRRRLGVAAMRTLAGALGVDWWELRCDQAIGSS